MGVAGCSLGAALSWLCVGCCMVWSFFHWPSVSSWTVTLIILGLRFLRARILRLCCTAAFPPIFLQLRKGPGSSRWWSCAELLRDMHSVLLISVEQKNYACPRSANCCRVCWEEGMGGGGVLVFQEVGTMKSLHWRCEMWLDCVERKSRAKLPASATAPRAFAPTLSFQVCLRAFICTFCMCVCVYVYVCMCADMYTCIYMHVCMCLYIYALLHMCMCMCMHICA